MFTRHYIRSSSIFHPTFHGIFQDKHQFTGIFMGFSWDFHGIPPWIPWPKLPSVACVAVGTGALTALHGLTQGMRLCLGGDVIYTCIYICYIYVIYIYIYMYMPMFCNCIYIYIYIYEIFFFFHRPFVSDRRGGRFEFYVLLLSSSKIRSHANAVRTHVHVAAAG